MSEDELNEIEARCNAATPELYADGASVMSRRLAGPIAQTYFPLNMADQDAVVARATANAEFFANARADIPKLIAALRECRSRA